MPDEHLKDAPAYAWPSPAGSAHVPIWTGGGFRLGDQVVPILSYEGESSGWTDQLTTLHEGLAGSTHPIDVASRKQALDQLRTHLGADRPVILEVGCSSGFMLREIAANLPRAVLIGADYVQGPLEKLAVDMPRVPLMQFDLTRCPLPADSIDAVVALNVLEHIRDDRAAVTQIHRILRPGGVAVIEVPAGPHLFDAYDDLLMHHRRYSLRAAVRMFEEARFEVLKRSHLGFFVYPMFWLMKQRNRRFSSAEKTRRERVVDTNIRRTRGSRLLDLSLRVELSLGRWASYPVGIRCLLTCRKRLG